MKKTTKLLIGTLCVISSTSILAHEYKGDDYKGYKGYKGEVLPALMPVTIPNFNGGVEFSIEALYLRPTTTNTRYLTVLESSSGPGITDIDTTRYDVDYDYDWGFLIGLGYIFPNTANDVQASWMQIDNNSSDSRNVFGSGKSAILNPPFLVTGIDSDDVLEAEGEIDTDFDAVDLTFGQYINIGPRLQTRLFAGLRYMKLDSELETEYELSDDGTFLNGVSAEFDSKFNGLGPLFGVKADYNLGGGFGVSALFDATLLVGNISFDANYGLTTPSGDVLIETAGEIDTDELDVISPGFDARLGLNYKYQMNNGYMVGLEIGYQVTKYFDVIEQLDADNNTGSNLSYNGSAETDTTNFGLNGLYLSLNAKI